jgi:hypothetical protein
VFNIITLHRESWWFIANGNRFFCYKSVLSL